MSSQKSAELSSDFGFLVSQRNVEVDDLNTTITSLRERIKTNKSLSDQLRLSAKSISMEIKDNFNPIQTNDNHINVANEISSQKSAQPSSDLGFLVSQRNVEVDNLNTTITSLCERIKTVKAPNDQLRLSATSIDMEIKDNFNPIQTNDNNVNVAAHSFKDPSQVNRLTESSPEVGLYYNMTEQKKESKTKCKLINESKEWLGRLPLIEIPMIRNLVKQPISQASNEQLQNQAERQYRPNKAKWVKQYYHR
jgi:orotate phosphoribosyltransferase-like protein